MSMVHLFVKMTEVKSEHRNINKVHFRRIQAIQQEHKNKRTLSL